MAAPEQPHESDPYNLGRFLAAQRDTHEYAPTEVWGSFFQYFAARFGL
jgi:hypothetical protein